MDLGPFLIETHLRTGRPIAELARTHDVHRSWLYKLLRRYRLEGPSGLEARSRRPHRSPSRRRDHYEDEIVTVRKELLNLGVDSGAETIRYHLQKRHAEAVPSVSTIWRVLKARGFVTPQPQKRPKSSLRRFCADLPNETWQADVTHVPLADGVVFEVLNIIDDHSRLCVASRAFVVTRSSDVVRTFYRSAETLGFPQSFLTDNGLIFSSHARHGFAGAFEMELAGLGIHSKHSRPYHPQTCGKVERFHQTLKKFIKEQDAIESKKQLQVQLDRFVSYYNEVRPHRAIGRRTPAEVYAAREKATPSSEPIDLSGGRKLRHDKLDGKGTVTLRVNGQMHHIPCGRQFAGLRVRLLVEDLDVRVIGVDGQPVRHLTLDPTKNYQPLGRL
ncbi:MAG TPA: IS481 family transposase [Acidimicrobiales bacterium]